MTIIETAPPAILSLLAEPRRWQLMAALSCSDHRVGELTTLLELPQKSHLVPLARAP